MDKEAILKNGEQRSMPVPFEVGKAYYVRTVTYHLVGRLEKMVGNFMVFERDTISWVAEGERFMQCINDGALREVEPVKVQGGVNVYAITDYFEWVHALPRDQK